LPRKTQTKKQPSGAQNEAHRRALHREHVERERERGGLNARWAALLERIGDPPLDPVGNSEWANNLAAAMTDVIARDATIPLEEKFKRTAELIDRIASTQAKAITAKRIREVREAAMAPPRARPVAGTVLVGPGLPSLRAPRDFKKMNPQ
jgi:hypothetical protein